jgi:APA family basic amino acid/polyamine antiporter
LFVAHFWDPRLALLIGLFAAISCIGALNGLTLVQGELPLAMARNGAFPLWFGKTSRRGTAVRPILLSSSLATVLIVAKSGGSVSQLFIFMILLSTAAALILYLACALAALRLQQRGIMARSATMSLVAGLAALYSVWTLYGAGYEATAWGAALIAAGIPVYFVMRRSTRMAAESSSATPRSGES